MSKTPVRLAIRGWKKGKLLFKQEVVVSEDGLGKVLPRLAQEHAQCLKDEPHMIEIEFLDEPDKDQRFFRFGTDPNGMRKPMRIDLKKA